MLFLSGVFLLLPGRTGVDVSDDSDVKINNIGGSILVHQ
jgi:hypothetical protein